VGIDCIILGFINKAYLILLIMKLIQPPDPEQAQTVFRHSCVYLRTIE